MRAGHDRAEHARRDVIRMALDARGLVENPQRLPFQSEQFVGDDHARRQRGGARSQPFADRNLVSRCRARSPAASRRTSAATPQRGLPDEVVLGGGNLIRVPPARADDELLRCAGTGTRGRCPAPSPARRNRGRGWRWTPERGPSACSLKHRPSGLRGRNCRWPCTISSAW